MIDKKAKSKAFQSYELFNSMQNISTDDNKSIDDYSLNDFINEAKYILACFHESGHCLNEWLNSDKALERKEAKKEINALKSFINQYKGA